MMVNDVFIKPVFVHQTTMHLDSRRKSFAVSVGPSASRGGKFISEFSGK